MSWTLVTDVNHWHDLVDSVIHCGWSLPLSTQAGDNRLGTLTLDTNKQLTLDWCHLLQLVEEQQLYFWL